jgi:dTDP-glucose 4,6-dehydratase
MHDGRVVPSFIASVLRNEPITVYGSGKQTRSFCYIDDLVEGIWRLLNSNEVMPVNLGSEFEMSIVDFARLIKKLAGSDVPIVYHPLPEDDPKTRRPDLTKARTLLGWEPKVSLEEGLRRTIEFFRANFERTEPQS